MYARAMAVTHPNVAGGVQNALIHCVEDCYASAQACSACADACLSEENVRELAHCIRMNLDCADVCYTTGLIATRRTGSNPTVLHAMLSACAEACERCAEMCEQHCGSVEHCRICAARCRECAEACREALAEQQDEPARAWAH